MPLRIVISEKTMMENSVEWKLRWEKDIQLVGIVDVVEQIKEFVNK